MTPMPTTQGRETAGRRRAAQALFLDIDGVLNCKATFRTPKDGRHRICRARVSLLNEIVAVTGCGIVVSSTWRSDSRCRSILRDYGLKARFWRDWRTPEFRFDHPLYGPRGNEIADWLSRNGSPPYAIVDDDGDMLPEQMPRFVQTSFDTGLTRAHADRLIALLSDSLPTGADAGEGRDALAPSVTSTPAQEH